MVKVNIKLASDLLELSVPEYAYKAYNEAYFKDSLVRYIEEWIHTNLVYTISPSDLDEAVKDYRRRKKGLDRIEAYQSTGM